MDEGIEKDPRAEAAIRRWGELKTERARLEPDWEDMARLIRPQRGGFSLDDPSQRVAEKPLSSAPIIAGNAFASELYGSITNPANRWFSMTTPDQDLRNYQPMKDWLNVVTNTVTASFREDVSSFYASAMQLYADVTVFGNSTQYDAIPPGERRILDTTLSLAEVVCDIDGFGRVVELVRKFRLTGHAAASMFKDDKALPKRVREAAQKRSPYKFTFYHHVLPNPDLKPGQFGGRGKRFLSHYVCEEKATLVREAGYREMPFYYPRWDVDSGATYGTGPGFVALASARVNQRMDDATVRAAQHAADPTKLAPDLDAWPMQGTVRPGAIVYGGVNMRGDPMLRNLDQHANIGLTIEEKRAKVEEIKDAFHWTLLSLAGRTGLGELEVLDIQAQRQRLWAPHMGRLQTEYLSPKVARRFSMLWEAGQIPPPPEGLQGAPMSVQYLSAAAAAQKTSEAASMVRIVQDIAPLAQLKPRLADRIDPDGYIEALAEARGAPAGFLLSREQADKIAEARAEAARQAEAMDQIERGGRVARDVAQAAQAGAAQPGA